MGSPHGRDQECESLVLKPEDIRSLRRPRRRWKDNTKINVEKIIWECMDWTGWEPEADPYEDGNEASGFIKCSDFLE
jgi:hypothetical protein